ncbi:MAG TPA: DNA repair exonuclease [Bacillales bacterium]|nr:DNA repair exonuclease [Bacillales bacterium]
MKSLRFIHCADLHLDRPFRGLADAPAEIVKRVRESTFHSLRRIVDAAIEHRMDFVIIAGDLFDGENRSLRAQARFRDEMRRLEEAGIEAFVIHGNHDPVGGDWVALSWPDNVHVFGPEVEVLPFMKNGEVLAHLYGFSYWQRAVTEEMGSFYVKKSGAPYHIGILHGQAEGNSSDHASYAPFTVNELLDKEFDYWALGHIHKRQMLQEGNPVILYSGNIQGLNPKETGEKGCTLVEMEEEVSRLSFIPTAEVEWRTCEVSISGVVDADQLLEVCEQALEGFRQEGIGVLAVIEFSGAGTLHPYLHQEENLEELLAVVREGEDIRENFVWPVSCRVKTTADWNREQLAGEDHFIGDLLRLIDNNGADDALSPLMKNRRAKRYLAESNGQAENGILRDAETLLLTELLREEDAE